VSTGVRLLTAKLYVTKSASDKKARPLPIACSNLVQLSYVSEFFQSKVAIICVATASAKPLDK